MQNKVGRLAGWYLFKKNGGTLVVGF